MYQITHQIQEYVYYKSQVSDRLRELNNTPQVLKGQFYETVSHISLCRRANSEDDCPFVSTLSAHW